MAKKFSARGCLTFQVGRTADGVYRKKMSERLDGVDSCKALIHLSLLLGSN
jgi:hypothetical protein